MTISGVIGRVAIVSVMVTAACGDNIVPEDRATALVVTPTTGLHTTEGGGQAMFTVALTARPAADVTITLASSNTAEGSVSPPTITLTPDNFATPVTVTVTGVNDDVADGDTEYAIEIGGGVAGTATVAVINDDNDDLGITVTPVAGLMTTEGGGTVTFTVVLDTQPASDVTIPIASDDPSEGDAAPASLTFTTVNWNAPQTVTVTGANDVLADGNADYTIVVGAATTSDPGYSGFDPADVAITNIDDDSPGIVVTPTSGLVTTEGGGTATFTVVLTSEPTADVAIALTSSDPGEGTVSPATLTFTAANFDAPQTVTVTGVNDSLADAEQSYTIVLAAATSSDTSYAGIDPDDVAVTNTDDDTAGFTVTPTSGLQTTESGGTATFTVVLDSQPTADVVVTVASSDPGEGTADPITLTFTPANFDAPQAVTVTGVEDALADGNQPYTITLVAASADPGYAAEDPADVAVTNIDNDTAGYIVTPTTGLQTNESGGTATFTVVLTAEPIGTVTIPVTSSDPTEGTVSTSELVFTTLDWDAPQTVIVTGVNDDVADGNQPYTIDLAPATSTDPGYAGLDPADVAVTNLDNDSAGIVVTPVAGLQTTEGGGTATFTVRLLSQPTADVTIGLASSDIDEGTVLPASVTFTSANFSAAQTITITGVDDDVADGNQPYTIVTSPAASLDSGYAGLDADNVAVTNLDNDTAGILVSPTTGLVTTEGGGTATFTVRLLSQPIADVTIPLSSSDTAEGTVSPASLTFTSVNFNAAQTVTITGVNDLVADGNQPYTIVTGAATSADTGYSGLGGADVSVTNLDNDSAGIQVIPTSGLVTTEDGGTATFTVRLLSQPTANVTIPLSASSVEGTVAPASLTFTAANFNAPQTVTITGGNDLVADGNQGYSIITDPAVSGDTGYDGLDGADVAVTNLDNDSAGIQVTPTTGLQTTEAGGTATFTIRLASQPLANVTIALRSSNTNEGTVSPASVTFTAANFNAPQTVTVTGANDLVADGNQGYSIIADPAVSADPAYDNLDAADVAVTNVDNDSAGIIVSPTTGLVTTEAGGTATFNVALASQPLSNVAISVASSDATEGTASVSTLVFTPANFSAPQTVTITGVNDALADGNQPYTIVLGAAASSDPAYANLDPSDAEATNIDNDSAGIQVTPTAGLVTTEAGGSDVFQVVLLSQPTANVTIAVSSSDTTEGTVVPATLTFTPANFNVPQSVTVKGVDDVLADGDQVYQVVLAAATSADPGYSGLDPDDVTVTNTDNDAPGFIVDPVDLVVSEFGDTDTFDVSLTSQPTANVTITLTSSDTTEGTVAPATLTFTPANFNIPQTVTVTGADDNLADGNQVFTIVTGTATSADPGYQGLNPPDVRVTNIDNETANVFVKARRKLFTTEAGGTGTFRVRLTTQPATDVTCTLASNDLTEGQVSPQTLVFTSANFNQFRTVTIIGLDDAIVDGDQLYTIIMSPCTSADPAYSGIDPNDVSVINRDND